jgi:hypothetical protein
MRTRRTATIRTIRNAIAIAAGLAVLALPIGPAPAQATGTFAAIAATDLSAQSKRKKRASNSRTSSDQQIACTQLGCNPIPRGCRVVPGKIPFTWDPSGFDDVICPYPR